MCGLCNARVYLCEFFNVCRCLCIFCGLCNVCVCIRVVCVMCGCVCVGCVMCGCCVCVGCVMRGCVCMCFFLISFIEHAPLHYSNTTFLCTLLIPYGI